MMWHLSTLAFVAYSVVRGLLMLRAKRGDRDFDTSIAVHLFLTEPSSLAYMLLNLLVYS
jgi:hypothetical protein